ncbi:MAG: FAD-dependent oxidoreductase [Pseudomonadota bacterium]|nr:FAD-dependent oxidoreductase [Pseudomonadota bacterium]
MKQRDYDVIIVGGGGGGLAAAITAHDLGASCIVLEADGKLGGATAESAGVFYAADTSVQRKAGIQDSPDAMFEYVMTLNEWALRPDLIRIMSDLSGPTLEWLIELGAEFPEQWLVCSGAESVPRGHPSTGAGSGIADSLINAAGARGIDTAFGTRVQKLIVEDGRVIGIEAEGMELYAPCVIVTTGGFANSAEMIQGLYPTAAHHGDRVWAVHHRVPYILGDGIKLGEAVGAAVTGIDSGLLLPTSGFGRYTEAFLPPWIILVNQQGRRFVSELASYSVLGYLMNEQTDQRAVAIFDETALNEASGNTKYSDPYNSGLPMPTWERPMLLDQLDKGLVKRSDTLGGLAEQFGVDVAALEQTVAIYNTDCEGGRDTRFFKQAPKLFPVGTPPFYGVEVRASIIGVTGAGLDIDPSARVLDGAQRPIPGLYAAGEVLGCIHGKRYAGGGMAIGNAVIFGRIAGASAAHAAKS